MKETRTKYVSSENSVSEYNIHTQSSWLWKAAPDLHLKPWPEKERSQTHMQSSPLTLIFRIFSTYICIYLTLNFRLPSSLAPNFHLSPIPSPPAFCFTPTVAPNILYILLQTLSFSPHSTFRCTQLSPSAAARRGPLGTPWPMTRRAILCGGLSSSGLVNTTSHPRDSFTLGGRGEGGGGEGGIL